MPNDFFVRHLLADATLAAAAARAIESICSANIHALAPSWHRRQSPPPTVTMIAAICSLCHGLAIQSDTALIAAAATSLILIATSRLIPAFQVVARIRANLVGSRHLEMTGVNRPDV